MVAAVVLVINLILTIWAVSISGVQNGLGTLHDGSCKRTATLTFLMHLAINVLSTLLLGASNYSMQCLSSPTRSEIDKAHGQGVWLDIGVPSVRNLRRLSTSRIVLWWLLAISSVPLHLLYNSAVFSSLCTGQYNVYLVSSEFLDGAPFDLSNVPIDDDDLTPDLTITTNTLKDYQKNQALLVKLEYKACVEVYTAPIISKNSDLLLVSTFSNFTNAVLFGALGEESQLIIDNNEFNVCFIHAWKSCDPAGIIANSQEGIVNISQVAERLPSDYMPSQNTYFPALDESDIQYCLSKSVEEHCKLQFSLAIMIVVIICNLIKTVCMSIIAWKQDPEPLVTLGDAIASFLDRPDVTTEGNCMVGKPRFENSRSWDLLLCRWDPKRLHWWRAASKRRWLACNVL